MGVSRISFWGGGFRGEICALGVSNCKHLTRFRMFLKEKSRRSIDLQCIPFLFKNPAKNVKSGVDSRGGELKLGGGGEIPPFPGFCMKPCHVVKDATT